MGMESFLVRITGKGEDCPAVLRFAESEVGLVTETSQSLYAGSETYHSFRDGRHVIEFEFSPHGDSFQFSVRFALCHPSSVDHVFISVISKFLDRFHATVTICEDLPSGAIREFTKVTEEDFKRDCLLCIDRSRSRWRTMFGSEEAGVTVSEALRRFVFPRCVSAES